MVADALSKLPSENMNDTELDEEIPEYHVEHVSSTSTSSYVVSTTKRVHETDHDAPRELTVAHLLREQHNDALRRSLIDKVDDINSIYFLDDKGIFSHRTRLEEAVQQIIPAKLQLAILYHEHDPSLAGHLGGHRMHEAMRRLYYWPHKSNDVYS